MEAKVDSMQPQESCGHKIYQDSTLEEKAVSKKICNTFEKVIPGGCSVLNMYEST